MEILQYSGLGRVVCMSVCFGLTRLAGRQKLTFTSEKFNCAECSSSFTWLLLEAKITCLLALYTTPLVLEQGIVQCSYSPGNNYTVMLQLYV